MSLTVITGANRGIGLALVTLLRERGEDVLATCRQSSKELERTGAEIAENVDVSSADGIARLAARVAQRPVGLLVNNAGILNWDGDELGSLDPAGLRRQFEVNALAPLLVTEALQKNLGSGSKVVLITSRMGSIGDNSSGGHYGYRMSKAALNIAGVSLARNMKSAGIAVAILHPGMVSTDMIGGRGQISPNEAAKNLIARIDALTLETSGTFWHANGEVLPW
jgi:NAD(P)-dependent dehydrogenase (short-subunit alcohol dehydrogenase family)